MNNYDFHQINDKEFEILICDLLSKKYGTTVERFKPGKDSGIDGRFFQNGETTIIQAKHYLATKFNGLLSNLKEELPKVQKLDPKRYIIATSLRLNVNEKIKIKNIFGDYIVDTADILGVDEINSLLGDYPAIIKRNYKLWIASSDILISLFNNAIEGRSEHFLRDINEESHKYVHTENHTKALKILKQKNVLIISGVAGIGKTTLAKNLSLYYVSIGYEFISIEESIAEAESVFQKGKKQFFYYDDFLGSNFFEAIENKKDSHIVNFIKRIKKDKTKKIILTSRTNIFNSGLESSHILSDSNIEKNEFMITIQDLKEIDKAYILYNHIFFSKLSDNFKEEIYKDKRYKEIIAHKNFNPRLIDFITNIDRLPENSDKYREYILDKLDNPKDVWKDSFCNQSNDYIRNMVLLCVFNNGSINEKELREAFDKLIKIEEVKNTSHTDKSFNSIEKLSIKYFLNRNENEKGEIYYTLFDPSITDFVLHEYERNIQTVSNIFLSLNSTNSLFFLTNLSQKKYDINKIKDILLKKILKDNSLSYDYIIHVTYGFILDKTKNIEISNILNILLETPQPLAIGNFSNFLELIDCYFTDIKFNVSNVNFVSYISHTFLDYKVFNNFSSFLNKYNIKDEDIDNELKINIDYILNEYIDDQITDLDLNPFIETDGDEDGGYVKYNEDKIYEFLYNKAQNHLDNINSSFNDEIDIQTILYDKKTEINDKIEQENEYYIDAYDDDIGCKKERGSGNYNIDPIDDLFEKI